MSDVNLTLTLYGIKDLRLEDKPIPEPGAGEVQISVRSVGICGTDVSFWQNGQIGDIKVKAPLALGHEPSGVITKLGDGVNNLQVGDRVAVEPNKPCGTCQFCKKGNYNLCLDLMYLATPPTSGALCRYFCHPASFVHRLPDNVSFDEGALVQPMSLGFYACQRADINIGDYVLVSGAGPLGMSVVLAAKARGASKVCVTDIKQDRLDFIRKIGADLTVTTSEDEDPKITSQKVVQAVGREVDASVECSGAQNATSTAIYSTRPRGVVCQVGFGSKTVDFPILSAVFKELDIRGMIRFNNSYPTVIEAISSGKVDVKQLISHRFTLENALQAYDTSFRKIGVKVIIDCERDTDVY
uniref:Sorbitol dehydrogenase n=1 Tax=Arion vulgaris TaxID=1028688 RepID=A0A0B6Z6E7_9EUPU